jgi:hypothetical protein
MQRGETQRDYFVLLRAIRPERAPVHVLHSSAAATAGRQEILREGTTRRRPTMLGRRGRRERNEAIARMKNHARGRPTAKRWATP